MSSTSKVLILGMRDFSIFSTLSLKIALSPHVSKSNTKIYEYALNLYRISPLPLIEYWKKVKTRSGNGQKAGFSPSPSL